MFGNIWHIFIILPPSGHLSLARESRAQNDIIVIASIFVNPTQYGENEDLDTHPRQLEQDVKLLIEIGQLMTWRRCNMQPLVKVGNYGCSVSLACILGSVRVIDNIVLS